MLKKILKIVGIVLLLLVILAFAIPFSTGCEKSPSIILQHFLHKPVAYFILPVFALANTAIIINSDWHFALTNNYTLGIALGLIVGKPIGIALFSYLAVKLKVCNLPEDINWKAIFGVGFLGGIGFTMSIFITLLAFSDGEHINNSIQRAIYKRYRSSLLTTSHSHKNDYAMLRQRISRSVSKSHFLLLESAAKVYEEEFGLWF